MQNDEIPDTNQLNRLNSLKTVPNSRNLISILR